MSERVVNSKLAVISDLHIGDKGNVALSDFDRDAELVRLLDERLAVPGGPVSLVIAGDFIDFPQILPELAAGSPADGFGTTEAESVRRVDRAIDCHTAVFAALARFLDRGNQLLLLPGNHDIDLVFPDVMSRLRSTLGNPSTQDFDLVHEGRLRHGRVYIEHGNQHSFDNRFDNWPVPILNAPDGTRRLERCWGTLFLDLAYTEAKAIYPFINRVHPSWRCLQILLSDPINASVVGARLLAFMLSKGKRRAWNWSLGAEAGDASSASVAELHELVGFLCPNVERSIRTKLTDDVTRLLPALRSDPPGVSMSPRKADGLLGRSDDEGGIEDAADRLFASGLVDVAIFGHTHHHVLKPRRMGTRQCRVINTGSWTPVVKAPGLFTSLEELRHAELQYDLRCLIIEVGGSVDVRTELINVE